MFSRPVSSGWKPVPTSSSEPTRPVTSAQPTAGPGIRGVVEQRPGKPLAAPAKGVRGGGGGQGRGKGGAGEGDGRGEEPELTRERHKMANVGVAHVPRRQRTRDSERCSRHDDDQE